MSIPAIGLRNLTVVAYPGSPDDRAGTQIQDRGLGASPQGRDGGVGPGAVGNFIVTAHRTSAGGPLRRLPALADGDLVSVRAGGVVSTYRIVGSLTVSFRSRASLARQSAAVPGFPGRVATRPMITISTCATLEDHSEGNYWADALGNPEHRLDKIGVLVSRR